MDSDVFGSRMRLRGLRTGEKLGISPVAILGHGSVMSALDALPHGPEFRFVDSLVELDGGKSARGRYTVRGDEAFLAGHFPGNPVMPGVILVEAIAQLGGVAAQSDPEQAEVEGLLLTGIRGAKILGAAVPGEVLEISAVVEGRLGPMIQVAGEVKVGDRVLATAKVQLAGRTPP